MNLRILEGQEGMVLTEVIWLKREILEGSYEYGNEPSCSINFWDALMWLSDWTLLKKGSAPWR
jgi:hypothetical protein